MGRIANGGFIWFRLVSGAGDIKITKDGNILLHEMVRNFSSCVKESKNGLVK